MFNSLPVTPGYLFFSFLYRKDKINESVFRQRLKEFYGELFEHHPSSNPLFKYYSKEMGDEALLGRVFFIPQTPFPRQFLLMTKLSALEWEREWSESGKRFVNVDTGLLTQENFLLATTKNYSHRIFIGQGIFVDLTYQCIGKKFETLPWTYPDYRDQDKLDFFNQLRLGLVSKNNADA